MSTVRTTTTEDAQANFRLYVEAAERGEITVVMKGDRPVARIVPESLGEADTAERLRRAHALIKRAAELRDGVDLAEDTVVSLIREGRERF